MLRKPITEPFEAKTVTLFQLNRNSPAFGDLLIGNMLGCYAPMQDMMQVLVEKAEARMEDEAILDACFEKFNNEDGGLQYSMSVGDVIKIDDTAYRCLPCGWAKI